PSQRLRLPARRGAKPSALRHDRARSPRLREEPRFAAARAGGLQGDQPAGAEDPQPGRYAGELQLLVPRRRRAAARRGTSRRARRAGHRIRGREAPAVARPPGIARGAGNLLSEVPHPAHALKEGSMSTGNRVFVIGVGMTKFERCERDVKDLAGDATRDALKDAGIGYDEIGQAFVGYINGMSTLGQQALYRVGMTGIPVYNVNNNC